MEALFEGLDLVLREFCSYALNSNAQFFFMPFLCDIIILLYVYNSKKALEIDYDIGSLSKLEKYKEFQLNGNRIKMHIFSLSTFDSLIDDE